MTRLMAALVVLTLVGCASPREGCLLDSTKPMTVIELFFGTDIPGRPPLTDEEWSNFSGSVIAKEFPDGFTVVEGDGQWFDSSAQVVTHERTKILVAAASKGPALESRITHVREAYRSMYRQTSVGVLMYDACGQF